MNPERDTEELKKKVQSFMEREETGPITLRELVHAFGVPRADRDRFKRIIKSMVSEGLLIKTRGGRDGLPSKMNLVTGRLTRHPNGFCFFVPEGGGQGGGGGIFISNRKLSGAMHNDTVVARVEGIKKGGRGDRREGSIIRVISRANKTIVGRFEWGRGFGVVIPSDERVISDIIIPPKEAKGATDGMIVSAEITRWPAKNMGATGRVLDIIGDPEDPDVEAEVILRKYGLPNRFPLSVMHEVKGVPREVSPKEIKDRVDLRERTVFTIDGETAKDFDDAVSIEKTHKGYRLWVSIADVSYYVKEGTEIDTEAYARSTSVYFPDRAIPMLPEALSNVGELHEQFNPFPGHAQHDVFPALVDKSHKRFYES